MVKRRKSVLKNSMWKLPCMAFINEIIIFIVDYCLYTCILVFDSKKTSLHIMTAHFSSVQNTFGFWMRQDWRYYDVPQLWCIVITRNLTRWCFIIPHYSILSLKLLCYGFVYWFVNEILPRTLFECKHTFKGYNMLRMINTHMTVQYCPSCWCLHCFKVVFIHRFTLCWF